MALSNPQAPLHIDSEILESSSDSSDSDYRPSERFRRASRYRARTGKRSAASTPRFVMGLGLSSLSWPPKDDLKADTLAKKKGKVPLKEKAREQKWTEPLEVHIAHYEVGSPRNDDADLFFEMILAIDGEMETLKRFTKDLSNWFYEKEGEPKATDKFQLYRFSGDRHCWKFEGYKRTRLPDSVILPNDMMNEIIEDVKDFLSPNTKGWYTEHGLPQRRSYLFYGRPGSGKTSTIRVIAGKFKLNCCFLTMTGKSFDNDDLADALQQLPENPLLVIEDVDALFNVNRENTNPGALTFSGLLNALDGLVSVDGVLTVLTTNHIEKLDKALIRGGRVDRRFLFDRPTEEMLRRLFLMYYKDAEKSVVDKFMKAVMDRSEDEARMIPTLQQLFIKARLKSAAECADGVKEFYEKHLPKEDNLNHIYM